MRRTDRVRKKTLSLFSAGALSEKKKSRHSDKIKRETAKEMSEHPQLSKKQAELIARQHEAIQFFVGGKPSETKKLAEERVLKHNARNASRSMTGKRLKNISSR